MNTPINGLETFDFASIDTILHSQFFEIFHFFRLQLAWAGGTPCRHTGTDKSRLLKSREVLCCVTVYIFVVMLRIESSAKKKTRKIDFPQ